MRYCRFVRSSLWRKVLKLSTTRHILTSSTSQSPLLLRQTKRNHPPRPRSLTRLSIARLVVAVCVLLTFSSVVIWVHVNSMTTRCQMQSCIKISHLSDLHHNAGVNSSATAVDVALVVGGESAARQVPTLVKSIFYNPIFGRHCKDLPPTFRFHIICSASACRSLTVLFETWRISGLEKVYFHYMENYVNLVNWIPNTHYSGEYGLVKLVIPDILPDKIKRVILLDLDTLVEGDLRCIWNSAEAFQKEEIIGLVENQSDWYLMDHGTSSWPALVSTSSEYFKAHLNQMQGRGFNTGVILMDLQKMREVGWSVLWVNVARKLLTNVTHTTLADQDIVNAALFFNSTRVHRLPCLWNLQLSDSANYSHCLFNDWLSGVKFDFIWLECDCLRILHWNRPSKARSPFKAGTIDYLKMGESITAHDLRLRFSITQDHLSDFNGNLLREVEIMHPSNKVKVNALAHQPEEGGTCSLLYTELAIRRRIFPYFFGGASGSSGFGHVTLVSQLTLDRLHRLEEIAAHWEGPMSLAVYLTDREAVILNEYLQSSMLLASRKNTYIHLVFQEGSYYPINALRNTAINYADTEYVFIVDFDFVPRPGLYKYFEKTLNSEKEAAKVAYIVPAFETFFSQLEFPSTKQRLLQTISSGLVKPFRIHVWRAGHLATNYSYWYETTIPYEVKWDADFEPYVLIRRLYGQFDEHFVGFGWNKVSFFMFLDALDFRFVVLPDAFIIHLPHAPSIDSNRFRQSFTLRQCLEEFKIKYIKDLTVRFGVKSLKYLRFRHRTTKV